MGRDRSFTEYVANRFYNELFAAIQNYVTENNDNLELRLYRIKNIGGIELSDIEVKFVSVCDLPDMKIEFDVALEAELEVRESDYHYDETEMRRQWFMLKCIGDLDSNLDDFKISSVNIYASKNKQAKPMSDSLVPLIQSEELEAVATDFLRRHYPEALKTPMAVEPQQLAKNMGLTVEMREITKDFSVFGQIYFHDCDAEFYDEDSDEVVKTNVNARTIFVDPKAYFLRNLGAVNNTIVHECVHWDKHRKSFELERLYNSNASKIKCQVVGGIKDSTRDATDWMEWQANALAPRIQMPISTFKTKAFELIKQYKAEIGTSEVIDVMEPVIDALASFFCVSRLAAKIRMIDVGYEEAMGTFTYIDGHYVKPHRFNKGTLQRNQTFSIGAQDAAILCLTNPELKKKIDVSQYQYIDSHFVLNHPLYIEANEEGNLQLTHFARNHMDECSLVFELSVVNHYGEHYHSECFLNRDESSPVHFNVNFHGGYENSPPESQLKLLREKIAEENRIYETLPNSFTAALKVVIDWKNEQIKKEKKENPYSQHDKITAVEIAKRTGLNEATVRRTLNDGDTSVNTLVLICLALHLPYKISKHIIEHSPAPLRLSNTDHQWYDFALQVHSGKTVKEVKEILQSYGAAPL